MSFSNNLDKFDYYLLGGAFLAPLFVLFSNIKNGGGLGKNSRKWPTTDAVIISSMIKDQAFFAAQRKLIGWKNVTAYTPYITYKYKWKFSEYQCSNIGPTKKISSQKAYSENILKRFPVGKTVKAYINPKKPSQAYIEPKNMLLHSLLLHGSFVVGFPLVALIVIYFKHSS